MNVQEGTQRSTNQRQNNIRSNNNIQSKVGTKTANARPQNTRPNTPPQNKSRVTPAATPRNRQNPNPRSTQNIRSSQNLHNQNKATKTSYENNELARKKQAEYAARMAAQNRAYKAYKMEQKRRRKIFLTALLYRFILFCIVLAILLSVFALIMHFNLNKTDKNEKDDFVYYLGNRKKEIVAYDEIMRNGEMYVNFSEIAKEFEISVVGSFDNMKFIPNKGSEYIRFVKNDCVAYINGTPTRMRQKAILENENMWVPLDFITEYTDGINVQYDEEKNILTIKRISFKTGYKDITFKIKPQNPTGSIELPEDESVAESSPPA